MYELTKVTIRGLAGLANWPHLTKMPNQGGHVLADMKFPVFSLCFPCVAEIFPVFFIEELTVIVIKEMKCHLLQVILFIFY